jgi:hypothetical protein
MATSLLDRSNYYKGLLILTGKDRIIDSRERVLMLQIGMILDFERRFCEAAIDSILDNQYITDEPVIFSSREISESFLRDGIQMALVDNEIHPQERAWLEAVAEANGIVGGWLNAEIQRIMDKRESFDPSSHLAIRQYL